MIDIQKAEEEFKTYTSNFDMNESHIERKVRHAFRVEKICEKIATSIGMNDEEIRLSKLIGILHDIARFQQYTIYKTYDDTKSIDHGEFGVKILESDEYIRKYIETDRFDDIILKSIFNHNKYCISNDTNDIEKIYCKIIRDADKLDIMYEATCEFWKDEEETIQKQEVNKSVIEQFICKEVIDNRNTKQSIDKVIRTIAFIFDLNFRESLEIIKDNNYIDKIVDRFNFTKEETKEQMKLIKKIANDYIENQINNK